MAKMVKGKVATLFEDSIFDNPSGEPSNVASADGEGPGLPKRTTSSGSFSTPTRWAVKRGK